ncbi:MAG: hypothetical protein KAT70_00405 [Thermoplasmata archaeon]|nr:hypothetical protein [Thermoplasmata archaeon]
MKKMVDLLANEGNLSPTKIAKKLHCDKRTVDNMLDTTNDLDMTVCISVDIEGRTYRSCSLTKEYKKIRKKKRRI